MDTEAVKADTSGGTHCCDCSVILCNNKTVTLCVKRLFDSGRTSRKSLWTRSSTIVSPGLFTHSVCHVTYMSGSKRSSNPGLSSCRESRVNSHQSEVGTASTDLRGRTSPVGHRDDG